jgi:membrane-associated phospholipid phosphatase
MAVLSLILPYPSCPSAPRQHVLRQKLWEWNAAWLGFALALAFTFMITEALKDLAGKPRPYLLDVCNPDLSAESISRWRVGGLGPNQVTTSVPIVVTWQICQTTDSDGLHNAFASWPSGHSSFSWAGMTYLTLFLCAKLGIHIPLFLPSNSSAASSAPSSDGQSRSGVNYHQNRPNSHFRQPQDQGAAPPLCFLLIAAVPIGSATYIALSRYFDYRHHGIDILSGSLIGAIAAYLSFRLYHLPIQGGAGWAWRARRKERAFWLGIGVPSYTSDIQHADEKKYDLENGRNGPNQAAMESSQEDTNGTQAP